MDNKIDYNNLDMGVVNLARAIRQKESNGGKNTVSKLSKQEGSMGGFQYLKPTFDTQAKLLNGRDLNGNPLDINNPEHQNLVFYTWAKRLKDAGYGVDQIAAAHNAGEGKLTGWENYRGVNKYGNKYDVPAYVNDVLKNYEKVKQENPQQEELPAETPTQPTEREQLISQGQPVSINEDKAQPSFGGELVRGLIKAPLSGALTIARGIAAPFSEKIANEGITLNTDYLGNVSDFQAGVQNTASQASQDYLSGNQSALKSVGKILGKTASSALDTAGILPLEGAAKSIGKGAIKQALTQSAKVGGAYGLGYGLSGSLEQGDNFTDTVLNTLKGGVTGAGFGVAGGIVGEGISKTAGAAAKKVQQKIVNDKLKALNKLSDYVTVGKVVDKAKSRGIDVEKIIAGSDLLEKSVDKNGVINTIGDGLAVDTYTKKFIDGNENLVGQILDKEGVSISPDLIESYLTRKVKNSGIQGEKLTTALNKISKEVDGYRLFANPDNGLVPLSVVHKAKVDKYSDINFMSDASVAKYDKTIAQGLKEIIEDNTSNNVDIKAINNDLAKHFTMIDYLKKLDNKRVEGGRLGKYFAKTIGAVVGGQFGPIGSVVGAELAGGIKGNQMAKTFKGKEITPIKVGDNIMKAQKYLDEKPLHLQSSNSLGNLKAIQPKTNTNVINDNIPQLSNKTKIKARVDNLINAAKENLKNEGNKGSAEVFKNTGDLTTKILKDLEGKTTVSKQYILDATNRGELKQTERDITRQVLDTMPDGQINVQEFADKVKAELLPLKVKSTSIDDMRYRGDPNKPAPKYENIALPNELRGSVKNYAENIYESPIKTSAGQTHFGYQTDSYFGHTRIEDMADNKTRRVIEVQSDLYQKGNLEDSVKRSQDFSSPTRNEDTAKNIAKLQQYNDPTAHFRMIREEIKKAAQDGKTKLQFPTGETALRIEGLVDNQMWNRGSKKASMGIGIQKLEDKHLRVGEIVNDGNTDWIVSNKLGEGKFKALPKDAVVSDLKKSFPNISEKEINDFIILCL